MRDCKGFSLLELMLVIVIAGILVSIGLPDLVNLTDNSKLDSAAKVMVSDLRKSQQLAVFGEKTDLIFTQNGTGYQITSGGVSLINRNLPQGVEIKSGSLATFTYNTMGIPSANGIITLNLAANPGKVLYVKISPVGSALISDTP